MIQNSGSTEAAAADQKRIKNTEAARRSRARKVEKQLELEEEIEHLKQIIKQLEAANDNYYIQNKLLKEEVDDCNMRLNKMQNRLLNILNKDK